MPLFIDDDPRSYDTFELSTASTLYWKAVPVLLRQADREDVTEVLTVRILSGVQKQNHSLRVLRVHLSSETDLFFLHTLEVTEEDFQNLKVEQGILVDFANFPGKIIGLLEKCIAARDVDSPRYTSSVADARVCPRCFTSRAPSSAGFRRCSRSEGPSPSSKLLKRTILSNCHTSHCRSDLAMTPL
jgi:hypothetical protein